MEWVPIGIIQEKEMERYSFGREWLSGGEESEIFTDSG
jgi:hypothetical protein